MGNSVSEEEDGVEAEQRREAADRDLVFSERSPDVLFGEQARIRCAELKSVPAYFAVEHLIADAHLRGIGRCVVVALAGAPLEPPHPTWAFFLGASSEARRIRRRFFVRSLKPDKDTVFRALDRGVTRVRENSSPWIQCDNNRG